MFSTQTLVALIIGTLASSVFAGAPVADFYAYPKYSYSYGVDDKLTGDHKSAHETRDGGIVKGSYSLLQPDGIFRTVEYVADPIHGFQAKVINSPGPAIHAVAKKVVAPVIAHGGYGYGPGISAVKPVVGLGGYGGGYGAGIGAVRPAVGLAGYGGYAVGGLGAGGYGGYATPGLGYGAVAAVKPAAVAYTQAYGPGIAHGGHGAGLGYAGAGIGGYGGAGFVGGAGAGFAGGRGGFGGAGHGGYY